MASSPRRVAAPQLRRAARIERMANRTPDAERMGCANLAHADAALPAIDKLRIASEHPPKLAVVTAYNDMLSAHQPLGAGRSGHALAIMQP